VATASPETDSTRPYPRCPPARAASEPRNSVAALAWQAACARPTRCWSRCNADQSASPVATAGTVPTTPAATSTRDARSVPPNKSSRVAEVQHPSGRRTSAGWAGCPNGTPCRASVRGPAGSARTTVSDRARTTGSRTCARSMRSARAEGRLTKRARPARRARRGRRPAARGGDCGTLTAYPAASPAYPAGAWQPYPAGRRLRCVPRSPSRATRRNTGRGPGGTPAFRGPRA